MPNYGIILIGNEDSLNRSSKSFASREFSNSTNRPALKVYKTYNNGSNNVITKALFSLASNYTNPFNPSSNLSFTHYK